MALTKVLRIRTHQALFVTGWGELKNLLPAVSKTIVGLSMTRVAEGVEVTAPGKPPFLVPWGNIVQAELADVQPETKTPPAEVKSQAV